MTFLNLGSIRKNIMLLVILAVLPAIAILFYSGMEERRNTIEHTKQDILLITHAMAQVQKDITLSARQILSTLSIMTDVQSLDIQASTDIFKDLLKSNPNYRNIALVDLSGNVLASGLPFKGTSLTDRKHFRDALETKAFATGEYIVTRVGDSMPAFPFAYPVLDATGTPRAVLTLVINLTVFSRLHQHSFLPKSGYLGVTDHQGVRLFYYPEKTTTNPIGTPIQTSNWEIARDAQEPGIMTSSGSDGTIRISAFEKVRLNANTDPYLYVWVGVPEAYILAPASIALKRNLLFMLLAAIGAFFVSWSIGRKTIIAPINQLTGMTKELAKGNLGNRVEQTYRVAEFKDLTASFHEMAKSLSASQEQQQKSEERFKKLSGVTFEGISIHKDGVVIDCNDSFLKLFGFTRKEIVGNTIEFALPSESQLIVHENISAETTTPYEVIARKKDGTLFPVEIEARNVTEGEDHYRVTAIRDITRRKQLEADQEKLLAAIHQTDEIIVITDVDAKIQYVNPAFEKITGYSSEEVIGQNPRILKSNQVDSALYDDMWATLISGQTWYGQLVNKKKDGSFYTEETTISPIFDANGVIVNYVGVKRDITEKIIADQNHQELEAQLRQKNKMEAVGYMAGGMAHNFNNNLSIILGNVELSQIKLPNDSEIKPLLANAKTAILRSRDLVKQITTYSRKGMLNKASMKLDSIVDETIILLNSTLPTTVKLQKIISPECETVFIHADASQIQEVLINLCNNAIHAMNEQGDLVVSLEPVELGRRDIPAQYDGQPGRYAKMSVQDTGCGMPAEMLDMIFDPFYTTKEEYEGAGMGLSTVQGIVAQHGGIIKVNSIPDQGTIFNLYFPIVNTEAMESEAEDSSLPRGTENILFVDDDEMLANLGEQLLTEYGYQVTKMCNSSDALKLFTAKADHFNVIITDQTMPDLTGKELIQEVQKINPDMPTILCTGFSSKIDEDKAKELGISAFLMKPLDLPKLLQTVRQVLDGDEG